jgi:hypothetical protein
MRQFRLTRGMAQAWPVAQPGWLGRADAVELSRSETRALDQLPKHQEAT